MCVGGVAFASRGLTFGPLGLLCLEKISKKGQFKPQITVFRILEHCVFLERTFVCCCYILRMYNWLAWICIGHDVLLLGVKLIIFMLKRNSIVFFPTENP